MNAKEIQLRDGRTATIRQVVPDDAVNALAYLDVVTGQTDFLAMGRGELDWPEEKERAFIEDHRQAENKVLVLAEIDGPIAAIAGFTGDHRKRFRHQGEFGVSVMREYWGLGLATALTESVIQWAIASRIVRKMNPTVRVDNERAISLYRNLGFVREGYVTRQFRVAGEFYDAYLMGLRIDP
jgi:RimJ/RimL family protein N-acetyltransferase